MFAWKQISIIAPKIVFVYTVKIFTKVIKNRKQRSLDLDQQSLI